MSEQLAYLMWVLALSLGLLAMGTSAKFRCFRKHLIVLVIGIWLLSAGFLIAAVFRKNPLFEAVKSGALGRAKDLLTEKPSLIGSKTFWDETALHLAVTAGNLDMVTFLLKSGADVNSRKESEVTPLHLAAFYGHAVIADALLKAGADVNAVGFRHKNTPLHVAALHGHVSVVKVLLAHGADVNAEDMLHETALDLAEENHQTNVIAVLSDPTPR